MDETSITVGDNVDENFDWAAAAKHWEQQSERCIAEAKAQTAIERWKHYADMLPELASTDWDHPDLAAFRPQIDRVLSWKAGSRKGLLLSGPTGRGKTRALFALWKRLSHEDSIDVRYWHATDWFKKLNDQVAYGRDEAKGWIEDIANYPLIYIDDFGQEAVLKTNEERNQAWFFRFLDLRVAKGLPILITTNLSAKQIAGANGDVRGHPLIRRFLDLCDVIQFVTPDELPKKTKP